MRTCFLIFVLTLCGCGFVEPQTELDPETGEVIKVQDSAAVETAENLVPFLGEYGDAVLGGALVLQNAYLLKRKLQRRKAGAAS